MLCSSYYGPAAALIFLPGRSLPPRRSIIVGPGRQKIFNNKDSLA
jgi:hypothetical protein